MNEPFGTASWENDELDLSKIFKQFKIHFRVVAAIMAGVLLLGFLYTVTRTTQYQSSATMAVIYAGTENESTSGKYSFSANIVDTFVLFFTQNIVLDQVAEETGYPVERIRNNLSVTSDNLIITLAYKDPDPLKARKILNNVVDVAVRTADSKDENGRPVYKLLSDSLRVFSNASEAKAVSKMKRNMILALLAGIFLACAYVLVGWIADSRYKESAEIEDDLDLPVFAAVPYYRFEERKRTSK